MPLAGPPWQTNLEDMLRQIDAQRGCGLLAVTHDHLFAELYVQAGHVICVRQSGGGQSLSEQLVNAGLVTPQQLDRVRALYQEKPITSDVDLGRALLQANYLTKNEMRNWFADVVIELLVMTLSWEDGECEFIEHKAPMPGWIVIVTPIRIVLDEALHRLAQRRPPGDRT